MQELITYQNNLLKNINNLFFRYLFMKIKNKKNRMLGIKGLRGTGKTTLLLQYLKFYIGDLSQGLYITADHPYFYTHTIFETAEDFHKYGGKYLLIDEVHKYENWSRELKLLYDGFPELKIIFSASSVLEIYKGESDLSRRVITYELPGLSFREYLELAHGIKTDAVDFNHILQEHISLSNKLKEILKTPLLYFRNYIRKGYFPFILEDDESDYYKKILQGIDTTITNDLSIIERYSVSHISKIKKLLGILAETVPFEPNISELSRKFSIGRDTVNNFLQHLSNARLINLLSRNTKGTATLKKPDKIYLENTNFSFALKNEPSTGTIRETFFLNQIRNYGLNITLPHKGDFLVDKKYIFEIGGKNKTTKQIKEFKNSFIASDEIEFGFANKIPLYLFGLIY